MWTMQGMMMGGSNSRLRGWEASLLGKWHFRETSALQKLLPLEIFLFLILMIALIKLSTPKQLY